MQLSDYALPAAAEFTDYSKWERRPSSKSGTSGGWSVGKGKGKWGIARSKRLHVHRKDAPSNATGPAHGSVLVDRAPDSIQWSHSCCQSSSKKLSNCSPSRPLRCSPERKIARAQVVLSPKHALLRVSASWYDRHILHTLNIFATDADRG